MSNPLLPSRHDGVRYLYMLAAFVIIVAGMRAAEPILNPLLLAVFLSVICAPAYLGLLRRGLSQWLALLIVAGSLSVVVLVLLGVVMQSISSFTRHQEHYQEQIPRRLNSLRDEMVAWLPQGLTDGGQSAEETTGDAPQANDPAASDDSGGGDIPEDEQDRVNQSDALPPEQGASDDRSRDGDPPMQEFASRESAGEIGSTSQKPENGAPGPAEEESASFMDQLYDQIQQQFNPGTVLSLAGRLAGSLGKLLSNALLIMLTVVFILLEVGSFREKLSRAFSRSIEPTRQAEQMVHSMQRYMAIKTAVSLATAVLIGIWLRVFDMPFIALWMLMAFLLNFIPNIGSIIAAVPAVLIAWLDFGIGPALGCAVGYLLVNVAVGNFLEPRLMGRDLGLSPLVIFCSMVFWGWVLGPVGMLLSVPLTMAVHIVLSGFDDTRWIATLMGGRASG